jgi:hypothetical protein
MNRVFKHRASGADSVGNARIHGKSADYVYQAATIAAALLLLLSVSVV